MEKGLKIIFDSNTGLSNVDVIGKVTIDESLALCMTMLEGVLSTSVELLPKDDLDSAHAVLYDKAVLTFSVMMDKFFPKAKDLKAKEDGFDKYVSHTQE